MKIDKQNIKTVALTLAIVALVLGIVQGVAFVKRSSAPGRQAAAYLDALIKLGQMPSGADVDKAIMQAQQKMAQAPAQAQAEVPKPEANKSRSE